MVVQKIKNSLIYLLIFLFSINPAYSQSGQVKKAAQLRALTTPCGYYLAQTENDSTGVLVVDDLDEKNLRDWLEKKPSLNPEKDKLMAVGLPFNFKRKKTLENQLKKVLKEYGYNDIEVGVIRRLSSFIADKVGVFGVLPDGGVVKISSLDPDEIKKALSEHSAYTDLLIVGEPLLGPKNVRSLVVQQTQRPVNEIQTQSRISTFFQKVLRHPLEAAKHLINSARYLLPIAEDKQKATQGEVTQMKQKLIVPGVLTFSVLLSQGRPLDVLIPVTLANASNSMLASQFRTIIGNWWSRSQSLIGPLFKQVLLSTYFTGTIFLASKGSFLEALQIISIAGFLNFISTQWFSIFFNTLWRTPIHKAVFQWERWRVDHSTDTSTNETVREQAAMIEKYMSYLTTQFYIYSIIAKDAFFRVFMSQENGLQVTFDAIPQGATPLMTFNTGHLVMLGVGLFGLISMRHASWFNPISGVAVKINRIESKLWQWFESRNKFNVIDLKPK